MKTFEIHAVLEDLIIGTLSREGDLVRIESTNATYVSYMTKALHGIKNLLEVNWEQGVELSEREFHSFSQRLVVWEIGVLKEKHI